LEEVRSEANKTITDQRRLTKEEVEKTMNETMNEVELEHEEQIQSLEYEIGWLKNQKESTETTLEDLRKTLSEKDEVMNEMEEDIDAERVRNSFHKLVMVTKALQLQSDLKSKDDDHTLRITRIQQEHAEAERRLRANMETLEKRASKFEGNMKLISSTLLNKNRDALLENKMRNREVATRFNEITEKMQIVDAKRQKMQSFVDNLVQAMYDVEKQIQDHCQTSALQGGKINISHARKKRRLDEE